MFPREFAPLSLWRYWYWFMNVQKCYTIEELECFIPPNCNNAIRLPLSIKCAVCDCLSILIVCLVQWVGSMWCIQTCLSVCSSQAQASSSMFQAECQWVCWIPELPAVVRSPEGTVHLVNMAGTAANTGLADTWLLARQPVGCPQARKTAGQGKQHSLCLYYSVQTWIIY